MLLKRFVTLWFSLMAVSAGADAEPESGWPFPYKHHITVKTSLQRIALDNGLTLIWKHPEPFFIYKTFVIEGDSLSNRLDQLSRAYGLAIGLCQSAKAIVVYAKGTPRQQMTCPDKAALQQMAAVKPQARKLPERSTPKAQKRIAPVKPKAPAPVLKPYKVERGERLSEALERWLQQARWNQVVWDVADDVVFDASNTYAGPLTRAVKALSQSPALSGHNFGIQVWKGNKTIRIHEVK